MNLDEASVLTCTYNHVELVDFMAESLFRQLGRTLPVTVVNNGDYCHFPTASMHPDVFTEVDDRKSKLVMGMLDARTVREASDRHGASLDYALKTVVKSRYCILVDDDILFKPSVKRLLEEADDFDVIGEHGWDRIKCDRLFPYFCVIDMEAFHKYGLSYWDRMFNLAYSKVDTGAAFLRNLKEAGLRLKDIRIDDYAVHMKNASLRGMDWPGWVSENRQLHGLGGRVPAMDPSMCAVTISVGNRAPMSDYVLPRNRKCLERMGVSFSVCNDLMRPERGASWSKIPLIIDQLRKHDIVLWLDDDAVLVKPFDVRALIGDCDMAIPEGHCGLNCGMMVFRNTPEAFKMLEWVDTDGWANRGDNLTMEQESVIRYLHECKTIKWKALPWNQFNANSKLRWYCDPRALYKPGVTTVMHFAGVKKNKQMSGIMAELNRLPPLDIPEVLKLGRKDVCLATCITGGYDTVKEPPFPQDMDMDMFCFCDRKFASKSWKMLPMPDETAGLNPRKAQRYVKTHLSRLLPDYRYVVYIDGSITPKCNVREWASYMAEDGKSFVVPKHNCCGCIYKEAETVLKQGKDSRDVVDAQMSEYRSEGFPEHFGMSENGIFIVRNDEWSRGLMDMWWGEIRDKSYRDQLSLPYCMWKYGSDRVKWLPEMTYESAWFTKARHIKPHRY